MQLTSTLKWPYLISGNMHFILFLYETSYMENTKDPQLKGWVFLKHSECAYLKISKKSKSVAVKCCLNEENCDN